MAESEKHFTQRSHIFRTLYYWGKILGLNPLTLLENNQLEFSYLSLFYSCLFGILSCYTFFLYFIERAKMSLFAETPITIIVDYAEIAHVFLDVLFTFLTFGFCQHRIKVIIESFGNAEMSSRTLGITEDYERHFTKLGIHLIIANTLYLFATILIVLEMSKSPSYNMVLWMGYTILQLPAYNSLAVFAWSIGIVRCKLHRLHGKMLHLLLGYRVKFRLPEENVYFGLFRNFRSAPISLLDVIEVISQQRRELIDLIDKIKEHFQVLVLLRILTQVPTILVNAHVTYTAIKTCELTAAIDWMYASAFALWVVIPVLILMFISNACGSTVKEANNTGNVLHEVLNSYENLGDSQEVMKINMFSFEVLQNRVSLSLFGLVDLDDFMVYKVLATTTAYFVIMLQFRN